MHHGRDAPWQIRMADQNMLHGNTLKKIMEVKQNEWNCKTLVSCKIERLRNHRGRCSIDTKWPATDSEAELETPEPDVKPPPAKRVCVCQQQTCNPKLAHFAIRTDSNTVKRINEQIGRLFYACNIPFNVAEHAEFKSLINILRPGFVPPSRNDLAGSILDSEHTRCQTAGKQRSHTRAGWLE